MQLQSYKYCKPLLFDTKDAKPLLFDTKYAKPLLFDMIQPVYYWKKQSTDTHIIFVIQFSFTLLLQCLNMA